MPASTPTKARAGKRPAKASRAKPVAQPHRQTLLRRLTRIEGQVRGVARMIEQQRYCVDVLNQVAAVHAALDAVAMQLLEDHTRGCVQTAVKSDRGEHAIGELMAVVRKLTR